MYLTDCNRHALTAERARRKMHRSGFTPRGYRIWTPAEDELCRRHHPDYDTLEKALPHRTRAALICRCGYLGITRAPRHFTAKDYSDLRRMYGVADRSTLADRFSGRSPKTLGKLARSLGLKRPRPAYRPTGYYLLDELRSRTLAEDLYMTHLDEFAGSGRYFSTQQWQGKKRVRYDHVIRAIHELGGRLSVTWDDDQ